MYYMDLSLLPADYEIIQNQDGEFICAPDGTLYKCRRNTSTYIQYEVDFINGNRLPKGWNSFRSQSGEFICDSKGRLRKFTLCNNNSVTHTDVQPDEQVNDRIFKNLIIPEGVRQIGPICSIEEGAINGFRYITVTGEIRFPDSLKVIGDCCFANSCLPDFVFPPTLEKMGSFAFGNSKINRLTIPPNMKKAVHNYNGVIDTAQNPPEGELWLVGRNFKGAMIDELVCPGSFIEYPLMHEAKTGQKITY